MGKFKQKKNKAHRNQPTGLKECEERELTAAMAPVSGSINHLMQKLQSESEDERECTCTIISSLTEQPGAVQQLLKAKAVKVLGPQLVSQNLTLKAAALGALRNMSVEGGLPVCEEMVAQDIMTPLAGMFHQFEWDTEDKSKKENQLNMFEQALHLLWNVCEASETAVSIFNSQNLLQFLIPCLNPDHHGINMAVAAAQCLYAVSDNNPAMNMAMAKVEVRGPIESAVALQQSSSKHLLLRTLAAGILTASSASLNAPQQVSVVAVLSMALEQDVTAMLKAVDELLAAAKACVEASSPGPSRNGQAADGGDKEGPCPQETQIKHQALEERVEEVNDVLQAQQLALQLLANMCCADDDDDDEAWEDSSDSTSHTAEEMDEDIEGVTEASLTVPTEVHAAFVDHAIPAKVLTKTIVPPEVVCARLADHAKTQKLIKSVHEVEVLALLCLGNLLRSLDTQQLGGAEQIFQLWQRLVSMATTERVCSDVDLLEAVTNVMQNTVQRLAQVDAATLNCMTVNDVQFLYNMRSSSSPEVRANVIRIVAAIGQALGKQLQPHTMMKAVGEFLLQCARMENNAWLIAEAVDAIMDVFAEDHLNAVVQELELVQKLAALAPQLKSKIKQQKSQLGEHLPVVITVKTNLPRFIQYKKKLNT